MAGISEQRHGAVVVLKPEGPFVQEQAEVLSSAAMQRVRPTLGRLVLDMSAAPYIDSIGLETLLDLSEEMDKCGQTLRLASVSPTVREVLDLTGLINRFEYHDDANRAVRSFL